MPVYTYTTIDDPLATTRTSARDINNAGQIVGEYIDSSNHLHGFLLSGGTYTILDDPLATPGARPSPYAIYAPGDILCKYSYASIQPPPPHSSAGTCTPPARSTTRT